MAKNQENPQESMICPRPSSQIDAALCFIRDQGNLPDLRLSKPAEKELVKKIDWMLMPLMATIYNLQYLDKTIRIVPLLVFFPLTYEV
jgi:hypothetical protein